MKHNRHYIDLDVIRYASDVSPDSRWNSLVGGEAGGEVDATDMATERLPREFL